MKKFLLLLPSVYCSKALQLNLDTPVLVYKYSSTYTAVLQYLYSSTRVWIYQYCTEDGCMKYERTIRSLISFAVY